jgi:hypothetical protein
MHFGNGIIKTARPDNDLQQEQDMRQASYEHGSCSSSARTASSGSRRRSPTVQPRIDSFVATSSSVQPRIDTTLKEGVVDKLAQAWSRWFHDIAGIKANCPYFQAAMRLTQELGTASRLFGGSDIDGPCLEANYKSIEESLEVFKRERDWKKYGVTVMCDSWTGTTSMSIINFMVYCHGCTFFHKAINASEHIQNVCNLCRFCMPCKLSFMIHVRSNLCVFALNER